MNLPLILKKIPAKVRRARLSFYFLTLFAISLTFYSINGCATEEYPYYFTRNRLNVAFVLDQSGSMGGEPLANMKSAVKLILDELSPHDYMSIVVFNDSATELWAPSKVTDRQSIEEEIDSITAGGGTNIRSGMELGYEQVEKNYAEDKENRLVLLTDGSGGESGTDILARDKAQAGIHTTAICLGDGCNVSAMQSIADNGDGAYYYVQDSSDLGDAFQEEITNMLMPTPE